MAELVALKTRPVETNEQAIALLRKVLGQAERGEVVSVAIASVLPNGSCDTVASAGDHLQGIIAALAILQFRMIEGRHELDVKGD